MEKEVKNILDEKIIVPLRYSEWVANFIPVRKIMEKSDSVSISGI
jgi:hypothetical protein